MMKPLRWCVFWDYINKMCSFLNVFSVKAKVFFFTMMSYFVPNLGSFSKGPTHIISSLFVKKKKSHVLNVSKVMKGNGAFGRKSPVGLHCLCMVLYKHTTSKL